MLIDRINDTRFVASKGDTDKAESLLVELRKEVETDAERNAYWSAWRAIQEIKNPDFYK